MHESGTSDPGLPPLTQRPITFLWSEHTRGWAFGTEDDEQYLAAVIRKERLAGLLAGLPAAALLMLWFAWFVRSHNPDMGLFAALAGALIGVPYMLYAMSPGGWGKWKRQVEQLSAQPPGPAKRRTVTLKPDGVLYESEIASAHYRWNAFEDVRRLPGCVTLDWTDTRGAVVVPISAFEREADADAWFQAAHQGLEASGYGQTERAKQFLDAHPMGCGKCGQSLRGLRERRCPECGETFTAFRLRLWYSLNTPLWRMVLQRLGIGTVPKRRN